MVNIEAIKKLTPEQLEAVQNVLALFGLIGITEEQLALLPSVLENWEKFCNNMNLMAKDLAQVRASLAQFGVPQAAEEDPRADTSENIRRSFGFDSHTERVVFGEGGVVK